MPSAQVTQAQTSQRAGRAGHGMLPSTSHCLFCVLQEMANSVYLVMEVSPCRPSCENREARLSQLLGLCHLGFRSCPYICRLRATTPSALTAMAGPK